MRARTWLLAAAVAMVLPGAASSIAGQPDPSAKFAAQVAAMAATGGPSTSAFVNRNGSFRFIGVINKVTNFSGPMFALIEFVHPNLVLGGGIFIEIRQVDIKFHGKLGRFDVTVPFRWRGADSNGIIPYFVEVYAGACAGEELGPSEAEVGPCQRASAFSLHQGTGIPMPPLDGTTTTVTVSFTE